MFLLHVTYPSGTRETLRFESAFLRGLHIILLTAHDVRLRTEDPAGQS
jgi:hypothetical protein